MGSHSSNLLSKQTHSVYVQPQPVLVPLAASSGMRGAPHQDAGTNKPWRLLLYAITIFCSLWGEMEG